MFRAGVIAKIVQVTRLPNGSTKVLLEARERARASRIRDVEGMLQATVKPEPLAATSPPARVSTRSRGAP